jgi:hypothetical protein
VHGQIYHGKITCSTIISKHSVEMREGLTNWYNEFRGICESFLYFQFKWMESVNAFSLILYMNGICECFCFILYMNGICDFFLLILYMNGICECVFIDPLYEWNLWMLYLMFANWMEYMNVFFIVCCYEWNRWMFLYCFLIWMDSVNVFYLCIWMESVNSFIYIICVYEWTPWNFIFYFYMNRICKFSLSLANMHGICGIFVIICLYEWNLWMFSLLFVKMNGLIWLLGV